MGNANLAPEARSELIRKKAFELFLERGGTHGQDQTDWLRAENIVERELSRNQPRAETTGFGTSTKITPMPSPAVKAEPLSAGRTRRGAF